MAGKRSPLSPSLSQLTSPPDKLCSNSRSLRYANSHHIPDGTGCNVENASYGLTICAERAAVFAAVAAGIRAIPRIAVAVATPGDNTAALMPCGACLLVLAEFMPPDGKVLIAGNGEFALRDLLPHSFALLAIKQKI
ncbi:MAG TPA: cytidine deaminase [Steroidobacteraceae bacterium]|nr:cytidine deaminase [Steroidobacteraceae bacterium]